MTLDEKEIRLIYLLCVCYVHMFIWVNVQMCVCANEGQRSILGNSLFHSLCYFSSWQSLFLNFELIDLERLAGQRTPKISHVFHTFNIFISTEITDM